MAFFKPSPRVSLEKKTLTSLPLAWSRYPFKTGRTIERSFFFLCFSISSLVAFPLAMSFHLTLPRWDLKTTLAFCLSNSTIVGIAALTRLSSVISAPLCGTLKSTRTKTFLPETCKSVTTFFIMVSSLFLNKEAAGKAAASGFLSEKTTC